MNFPELKTEQRILMMMKDMKDITREDKLRLLTAFDKLQILSKEVGEISKARGKLAFLQNIEEYKEKMQWINDYVKSKGCEEIIFTKPEDYDVSSDDYDYYYAYKTPTQIKEEEEKRKQAMGKLQNKEKGEDIDIPE